MMRGKNSARPHISAGEADPREQKRRLGLRRREPQIGGHGENCARAGADPVDRGDDRLRAFAHRLDDVSGHSRECNQVRHFHFGQRFDDLEDVAARGEVSASARQHDRAHIRGMGQIAEEIAELSIGVEGQRILAFRPIEPHRRDAPVIARLEAEMASAKAFERLPRRLHRRNRFAHPAMTSPPATTIACPFIEVAAGEASQSTASATSSGVTRRR